MNRAAKKALLFSSAADYAAVEEVLVEAKALSKMRLLAYCIMPNHWHLVLWPQSGNQMSQFMRWFTGTHAQRWHAFHKTIGTGAVYQGRYKAIPIQTDLHFLNVCRYVERNPLRAGLVQAAEAWPWSSLARALESRSDGVLDAWPIQRPGDWVNRVNGGENREDLERIRRAVKKGLPLGGLRWTQATAEELGLEASLRARGRPATRTRPRL